MKKRIFYGTLICVAIIVSVFYACKKNEPRASDVNPASPLANSNANRRTPGEVTYYSKSSGDVVYKMVLTTDEDGNVSIDRSEYETEEPDTIKCKVFVGEGVSFIGFHKNPTIALSLNIDTNRLFADTLRIEVPSGKTYFIIPFDPTTSPEQKNQQTKYYCQCGCSECATWGDLACLKNGDEHSAECIGICDDCKAIAECGYPSLRIVSDVGGLVIIDANAVNVVN